MASVLGALCARVCVWGGGHAHIWLAGWLASISLSLIIITHYGECQGEGRNQNLLPKAMGMNLEVGPTVQIESSEAVAP